MKKPNHDGYLAANNHVGACAMYLVYTGDNPMQTQVQEFMQAVGQKSGDVPGFDDVSLRHKLIREEFIEFEDALIDYDFPEAIDALADMMYVIIGTFEAFGVDAQTIFNEVHRTNMLKLTGAKDEHGKQLKPPNWKPPRIRELLIEAGWVSSNAIVQPPQTHNEKIYGGGK